MLSSRVRRHACVDMAIEMRRAAGFFCLALVCASYVHGAEVAGRPSSRLTRRSAWCMKQIPGCIICTDEKPQVAAGAQYPGSQQPPALESIVRCYGCKDPYYMYNKANQNCDCAAGAGTAFANDTLISVSSFEPATPLTNYSDSMQFPDQSSKGTHMAESSEVGVTQNSQAISTTADFASTDLSPGELPCKRSQAACKRRFRKFLQKQGYNVRTTPHAMYISNGKKTRFSSAQPVGVKTSMEQPLVCIACRPGTSSKGGVIGGSFCMP